MESRFSPSGDLASSIPPLRVASNRSDLTIEALADAMMHGVLINCSAVKMHQNKEVFRLLLEGFRFTGYQYPTWDVNGEDKFTVEFQATVHKWTKI